MMMSCFIHSACVGSIGPYSSLHLSKYSQILDVLKNLVRLVVFPTAIVSPLTSLLMASFFQPGLGPLQEEVMDIITHLASKYPEVRPSLIEDYLGFLQGRPETICDTTAKMLFSFIEACCEFKSTTTVVEMTANVRFFYSRASEAARYFIESAILKIQKSVIKETSSEGCTLLLKFIRFAAESIEQAQDPGAILFLRCLFYRLLALVNDKASPTPNKLLAVELLGEATSQLFKVLHVDHLETPSYELTPERIRRLIMVAEGSSISRCYLLTEISCEKPSLDLTELVSLCHSDESACLDDVARANYLAYVGWIMHTYLTSSYSRLVQLSTDEAPTVRVKALRGLATILGAVPDFSRTEPSFFKAIGHRLTDDSVIVRDVAMEVITKSVPVYLDLISLFRRDILLRMVDSGVNVRKRAVKLIKEVYLCCSGEEEAPFRIELARSLFQKFLDPESSIKDTALRIARELFLFSGQDLPMSRRDIHLPLSSLSMSERVQLMDSISILSQAFSDLDNDTTLFVLLFDQTVIPPGLPGLMLEAIFDLHTDTNQLPCLTLIRLLATWRSELLVPYFSVLVRPFLQEMDRDRKSHQEASYHHLELLNNVVRIMHSISRETVVQLERSLISMLFKHSEKLVSLSVQVLGTLANKELCNIQVLANLWHKLYGR